VIVRMISYIVGFTVLHNFSSISMIIYSMLVMTGHVKEIRHIY